MRILLSLLLAAAAGLFFTGCVSDDSIENASSRPWNQPRGWEHGLPSGINEGR